VSQQRPLWFQDWEDPPPFIKALEEVRRLSCLEGWCFFHVQAIQVAIDQYARRHWATASSPLVLAAFTAGDAGLNACVECWATPGTA
jgi:hypothetical protein